MSYSLYCERTIQLNTKPSEENFPPGGSKENKGRKLSFWSVIVRICNTS